MGKSIIIFDTFICLVFFEWSLNESIAPSEYKKN
jgi:hypothetical protein